MDPTKKRKAAEDEYFAKIEFEKKQKALKERDLRIAMEEKEKLKALHWMRCPKCGMEMIEIDFEGIQLDKCSGCLGLFFDDGEVQQLIDKTKPGFLRRLTTVFKD